MRIYYTPAKGSVWNPYTDLERTRFEQEARERSAADTLLARTYAAFVTKDAEARWLFDKGIPGAFAKARAANRLAQLDKQPTCATCGGRGFCQCDPLTPATLKRAILPYDVDSSAW